MITLVGKNVVFFDVDDTLIFWYNDGVQPVKNSKPFIDPNDGEILHGVPNLDLIAKLKKHKKFGKRTIVVWSQSGYEWASYAVKWLQIEEYVDLCIAKPIAYYDDLQIKDQGILYQEVKRKELDE